MKFVKRSLLYCLSGLCLCLLAGCATATGPLKDAGSDRREVYTALRLGDMLYVSCMPGPACYAIPLKNADRDEDCIMLVCNEAIVRDLLKAENGARECPQEAEDIKAAARARYEPLLRSFSAERARTLCRHIELRTGRTVLQHVRQCEGGASALAWETAATACGVDLSAVHAEQDARLWEAVTSATHLSQSQFDRVMIQYADETRAKLAALREE